MSKWWENYDWRFIQTNLREVDMKDINAKQYVADLKSFHATLAMINTSGIIASYKTKLPYHYQSPYLTGDSLQDIIAECHKEGIKVMARTDFSKIRREIYEAHPDWAFIDKNGNIVDYNGDVHVCLNSDYQQKYALEIIRETLEELDVDGIFFNMGGYISFDYSGNYHGICQCQGCRKRFKEMYGLPLPKDENKENPVYKKYLLFKQETTREYNEKVCRFIKSIRPDILINHDIYTEDSGFIRQESNTALNRALPHWQYSGSENTKWVRGSYPKFISSNTSVDFIDFPQRHVSVSPYQQELRLYQNLANGGSVDYYLIGRLDNHRDKSCFEGIRRVFHFHKKNEQYYKNLHGDCDTVVITGEHWGGHGAGDMAEYFGLYRVLTETHQLFDVMILPQVKRIGLSKYKNVILPNLEYIDDETAQILDDFVAAGNTLLATGTTSFIDVNYEARNKPALDCLGITSEGVSRNVRGAYFTFGDKEAFSRFADCDLVSIDGDYFYVDYAKSAERYLNLLPPQPYGPPERCYPLYGKTHYPAVAVNAYGKGIAIHIPWLPGRYFHRQGYMNTFWFLADVYENLMGLQPIEGNIPPTVEITLLKNEENDKRIFHLVNNNGHFGNSFFEPTAVYNIQCRIPISQEPDSVVSLIDGKVPQYKWEQGYLTIQLDKLERFEALLIAL
jgi:hypothetical protein